MQEHRANDPKQLAFKEAMKARRREMNELMKARRKAAAKAHKAHQADRNGAPPQRLTLVKPPAND